jgi:hypothetical protein
MLGDGLAGIKAALVLEQRQQCTARGAAEKRGPKPVRLASQVSSDGSVQKFKIHAIGGRACNIWVHKLLYFIFFPLVAPTCDFLGYSNPHRCASPQSWLRFSMILESDLTGYLQGC